MSRKQYVPHQGSHQKKVTRKERKKQLAENPINNEGPIVVTAPDESDRKQLRSLTLFAVVGLFALLILMYFVFVN